MLQKIKSAIIIAATMMVGTTSLLGIATMATVPAYADISTQLCNGVGQVSTGQASSGCSNNTSFSIANIATSAVNILSWIVGVVAVIMIIVGGFRYITSGGSSDKIGSAKNTLIYAIIGLVIVVLAQFIVHFVVTSTQSGSIQTTTQ